MVELRLSYDAEKTSMLHELQQERDSMIEQREVQLTELKNNMQTEIQEQQGIARTQRAQDAKVSVEGGGGESEAVIKFLCFSYECFNIHVWTWHIEKNFFLHFMLHPSIGAHRNFCKGVDNPKKASPPIMP